MKNYRAAVEANTKYLRTSQGVSPMQITMKYKDT